MRSTFGTESRNPSRSHFLCIMMAGLIEKLRSALRKKSPAQSYEDLMNEVYDPFHEICSSSMMFSKKRLIATRESARVDSGGIVFSARPIRLDGIFQVKVLEKEERFGHPLTIGFTLRGPDTFDPLPTSAMSLINDENVWIFHLNKMFHNGESKELKLSTNNLKEGDSIGCCITRDGKLEVYINGKRAVGWPDVPTDKDPWGFVDIFGGAKTIQTEFHCEPKEFTREIQRYMEKVEEKFDDLKASYLQEQPTWRIARGHLKVTEEMLGKGSYGEVRVGIYQGTRVAVKMIHEVIISDYNCELFEREMRIAARVHHPNLVLFVGAVITDNLMIVNELMETSLRNSMAEKNLKDSDIHPVSKDVACALVYLHSLPGTIVHRDVSSANVLLNTRKNGWQAKLGDFGSANFLAKLGTAGPGCPTYAAPEAVDPKQQGPKMDVYSFGVLLLEMCVGKLVDPDILESTKDAVVTWSDPSKKSLGEWAKRCTERNPTMRPTMGDFIEEREFI